MEDLQAITLSPTTAELSEKGRALVDEGRRVAKKVNCFDFVPSNYELAWRTLDSLPRGRLCEWGSGLGIVTGLAELLGFEAFGIELDCELCRHSRQLLGSHQLKAQIFDEDYFHSELRADYYYVYCWPSVLEATESLFGRIAKADSLLLICYGQDDIRGFKT
jgi:hypothetical protein